MYKVVNLSGMVSISKCQVLKSYLLCVPSTGQVTGLQRGPTTERWEYDSQGRIISRVFADGKIWSYTYLDKVVFNSLQLCISTQQQCLQSVKLIFAVI